MTQTQGRKTTSAPVERAEQLLGRAGEQLGLLAGRTAQRLQQVGRTLRAEADQMDASLPGADRHPATREQSGQPSRPATERAEEMVEQFGQRMNHWAQTSNSQMRRALARLREDTEDMWVEAHAVRGEWRGKREQA